MNSALHQLAITQPQWYTGSYPRPYLSTRRMEHPRMRTLPETHYPRHHQHSPWHPCEGIRSSHSRTSAAGSRRPAHCPSLPRRSRTTGPPDYAYGDTQPWEHMAQTYAWVLEQEIAEMARKNEDTVRWVLRQQEREVRERTMLALLGVEHRYRRVMEDLAYDFERESGHWKARNDESRRRPRRWPRDVENVADEELQRLYARRLEEDRYRTAHSRRRAQEDARERERQQKERERVRAYREQAERLAWERYESQWAEVNSVASSSQSLDFNTIPWPVYAQPQTVENITPARIAMFIFSPSHSQGQTRKERIKHALRRWHPDRFGRLLTRIAEEDRPAVEEGVGIVARCLNNLMEREG